MEPFSETDSSCKAAAYAFIDGWDSVLNPNVDAGVYANHRNVDSLASLAHVPDAVDIAEWNADINSAWGIAGIPMAIGLTISEYINIADQDVRPPLGLHKRIKLSGRDDNGRR